MKVQSEFSNANPKSGMKYKLFFVSWSSKNPNFVGIARELKSKSCYPIYWVTKTGDPAPDENEFPGVISQDMYSAVKAYPARGIDDTLLEPPGKDVIEALFECESIALSMMNRIDFPNVAFHRRKMLYHNMLTYWYGILRKMKPDAIVFPFTPHAVFDFVLYSLAKFLGIKTIILYGAIFTPGKVIRTLIVNDIKEESPELIEELNKTTNVKLGDLSSDIRDYYISRSRPEENFRYTEAAVTFLSGQKKLKAFHVPSLHNVFINIKEGRFFSRLARYLRMIFFHKEYILTFDEPYSGLAYTKKVWEWRRKRKNFRKEYEALQTEVGWGKKFIFVPLHYQPESATSPGGGVFVDQYLMIRILSHSIPKDWVIYVKEHPIQWLDGIKNSHMGRYKGYYKEIASLKNVFLIPAHITPPRLIERCQAVATITGTAGLEAIFKGKPALIFGYAPYKECTEIFKVSDVESCREAIEKISNGYKPDMQRILNYLGALDRVSIKSYIYKRVEQTPLTLRKECIKKIADGIYYELQRGN